MEYEKLKIAMDKRKANIVWVMGDRCALCGYDSCSQALELHHIDPKEKDFSFGKKKTLAWAKIFPELKKCILLCANCHREVHYPKKNLILVSSFIPERAEIISEELSATFCVDCGKKISSGVKRCVICASLEKRKVERPNREELKKLVRTSPFTTIATQFGVTDNAIRSWCKTEGIPSTKKEIKTISNEDWEVL